MQRKLPAVKAAAAGPSSSPSVSRYLDWGSTVFRAAAAVVAAARLFSGPA
jgi:hypothetical protein